MMLDLIRLVARKQEAALLSPPPLGQAHDIIAGLLQRQKQLQRVL